MICFCDRKKLGKIVYRERFFITINAIHEKPIVSTTLRGAKVGAISIKLHNKTRMPSLTRAIKQEK